MPAASRWLIRFALAQLLLGTALGSWMLASKAGLVWSAPWAFPVHLELMLFGWMLQLVLGVALWILPRRPEQPRDVGARAGIAVLVLLNLGVAAGIAAAFAPGIVTLPAAARLLEVGAAIGAVVALWPRARAFGRSEA